VRQLIT